MGVKEARERRILIHSHFRSTGKVPEFDNPIVRSFGKISKKTFRRDLKAISENNLDFGMALQGLKKNKRAAKRRGIFLDYWKETKQVLRFDHPLVQIFNITERMYDRDLLNLGKHNSIFARSANAWKRREKIYDYFLEHHEIPFQGNPFTTELNLPRPTYRDDLKALSNAYSDFARLREVQYSDNLASKKGIKSFTIDGIMQAVEEAGGKELPMKKDRNVAARLLLTNLDFPDALKNIKEIHSRFREYRDLRGVSLVDSVYDHNTFKQIQNGEEDDVVGPLIEKAIKTPYKLSFAEHVFFRVHSPEDLKKYPKLAKHADGFSKAIEKMFTKAETRKKNAKPQNVKKSGAASPLVEELPEPEKPKKVDPIFTWRTFQAIQNNEMDDVVGKLISKASAMNLMEINKLTESEKEFFRLHVDTDFMQYPILFKHANRFLTVRRKLFPELKD